MHCGGYLKTSEWANTLFMNSETNANRKTTSKTQDPQEKKSAFMAFSGGLQIPFGEMQCKPYFSSKSSEKILNNHWLMRE